MLIMGGGLDQNGDALRYRQTVYFRVDIVVDSFPCLNAV